MGRRRTSGRSRIISINHHRTAETSETQGTLANQATASPRFSFPLTRSSAGTPEVAESRRELSNQLAIRPGWLPSGELARDLSPNDRPRHLHRKIFSRFYRAGDELERRKPGVGLGLFLVRSIVERLKGSITVSERINKPGATFLVTLPARQG
ncbi:MAG: ATP-binding protein [Pirellula sp.]